ncbi:MAG: hypothetical protein K2M09_07265 [Muribaculaceae bacterium]|nr:hypothetical protein [Muribaculaceae bacterium]
MKISIIGAGNVGSNFAARFRRAGVEDVSLYSPSLGNMSAFNPLKADAVIIAVTDDAIPGILASLP